MFFPGSRYQKMPTYTYKTVDGRDIKLTQLPLPQPLPLLGYHQHKDGERLDHLAARYLLDPTAFWRLCDLANSPVPGALERHALIPIPRQT